MKITPLEIRQKTFEKNFRGYERDEVHAFLLTLSQEWERMMDENKELRIKLETAEREVSKLREVETSLFKTLKTAEDTGANVIDQARKTAELHLRETQMKADALLHEARSRAQNTLEEAEMRAREVIEDMEDRLRLMVENYKKLESSRDDLLSDLKRMASETLEKVERARESGRNFDADRHLNTVRRESKKIVHPNAYEPEINAPKAEMTVSQGEVPEPVLDLDALVAEPPRKAPKSFFDDIN